MGTVRVAIVWLHVFGLLTATCAQAGDPAGLPSYRLVPKSASTGSDRRARRQPTVPDNYRAMPFQENAPAPVLSLAERRRGYLLFQRPITEPVYPNTHPLAHERVEDLSAFATPGEFEPVTFSVYPQRDLVNFRVTVSPLKGPAGEIAAQHLTVRLATYWNVGYPRYTSRETYRRLPELLERVTAHSSPARECQRWWIRIDVPDRAQPGLYRGTVTVQDDSFDRAVEIPLALRVLGFKLQRDPAKHYSVYYYVRNRVQFAGKDEAFIRKATGNEYRAMVEYGLDMLPTFSLGTDDRVEKIVVRNAEELDRMLAAGLKGPLPITGGNAIERIYRATTPGGKRGSHWQISKMPPPEFYQRVTAMFRAFDAERRGRGWPEVVCCPLDEVAASHKEFGWRVYKAVRDAGIRTYATKNPRAADADVYRPAIDVWCSQPYSMPYEKIVDQDRYEYWCYPNHNAGERKDRRIMCKGGRMTYGFGFWRSGYTTLIPWHWAWTPAPDQFDYLRGSRSGCGQRIDDDGEVIPAIYWECFREGYDDARYLYTLQQAICQRDGSRDPQCRRRLAAAKALLQETWDAIHVQQKYLADGMWPSAEFNARRWRLAQMIEALLEFPATQAAVAPSVLVANTAPQAAAAEPAPVEQAERQGNVEKKDLAGDFRGWRSETREGKTEVTPAAGRDGKPGLRWTVTIDHKSDGGESGKYPVGWPRVRRAFAVGQLNIGAYDYLEFTVRVDSDRDEVADDATPLGLAIGSHEQPRRLYEMTRDLGGRQRVWIPIRLSVKEMMATAGAGPDPWKKISHVQLFVAEHNYRDGTRLTFDIGSIKLLRFTAPMISRLEVSRFVMLPCRTLAVAFNIVGFTAVRPDSHRIEAELVDAQGKVHCESDQDLTTSRLLALNAAALTPGRYTVKARVMTAAGELCSESAAPIEALAGPLEDE
jgi:hypothetical protein